MCNVHPNCHACSFSYGTYREIWSKKLDKAINILSIDKNKSITLHPNDQWHYRKKSLLHVDSTIIPPKIGLIQNNDVVNINNCPLHSQSINELIEITGAIEPSGIPYIAPVMENKGPSRGNRRPRPNSSERRRRPR